MLISKYIKKVYIHLQNKSKTKHHEKFYNYSENYRNRSIDCFYNGFNPCKNRYSRFYINSTFKLTIFMELQNEYRHILKGSEKEIAKGRELTKHLKLPGSYDFSDALLYQIGRGERDIKEAEILSLELPQRIQ